MKLQPQLTIDTAELLEGLARDEAEQLIKDIDLEVADFDFTESMAKYFLCESGGIQ